MPVTLNPVGKRLSSYVSYVPPESYRGEAVAEDQDAGKTTTTLANAVYSLGYNATVLDGTNQVSLIEINAFLNDYTPATGAADSIEVDIWACSEADGTLVSALGVTAVFIGRFRMIAESRNRIPVINKWSKLPLKIASAKAGGVFNWDAAVIYFTPRT